MKILAIFLTSWAVGLTAYLGSLALFYQQSISSGDLYAVLSWSLLAFAPAFFALYLPVLLGLRRLLRGVRPLWPFPLLAVLLGVVPTALILFFWGGGIRLLLSPEAALFYSMFAAVGVVVGFGFAFIHRHDHAVEQIAAHEPPPLISSSVEPDRRPLDSPPAPASAGGRPFHTG